MSEFLSISMFPYQGWKDQRQWLLMEGSFWWKGTRRQGQFPAILAAAGCPQETVCLLLFVSFYFFFFFLLKVSVWFILKGDGDLRAMTAGSIPRRTDTWSQSLWNQRLGLLNCHCALSCLPLLTCLLTPHSVSSQLTMCRILNCHQIWSQDAQS